MCVLPKTRARTKRTLSSTTTTGCALQCVSSSSNRAAQKYRSRTHAKPLIISLTPICTHNLKTPQNVRAAKDASENEENFELYYHNGLRIAVREFEFQQGSTKIQISNTCKASYYLPDTHMHLQFKNPTECAYCQRRERERREL